MATVAAIAVGALCCVALGLWPKAGAAVLLCATVIAQTLQTMTGSSLVGYVDELAVLVAAVVFPVRRLLIHGTLRFMAAYWCFAGYAALGIMSALMNSVPLSVWAVSGFLFLKGPLLMLGVLQIDWQRADLPRIARFGTVGVLIILVSALLNAVAPEAWNSIVGRQDVSYRLGIPSLTGIFDHPVGLASVMGMAFLAILSYRRIVERSVVSFVLLLTTGVVGILTFRRKSIASVAIVAVGSRLVLPGRRTRFVVLLAVLLPVALLIAWQPLVDVVTSTYNEYFSSVDTTARTTMTIDSARLAAAAFPLGVGLGRFGSAVASSNYSPLYEQLGYTRIYGMGPGERGGFLTDTFWPSILAETGIFGLLLYVAGLMLAVRPAWKLLRHSSHPYMQWVGTVAVAWMGQLLIESIAAPVFTGPPMFGPVFMLAGIAAAGQLSEEYYRQPYEGYAARRAYPERSGPSRIEPLRHAKVHSPGRYRGAK
ncbi:hypothetical protein IEE91_01120 [Kocuria sp. cx-455]|uniref:hypothetical protein n=1 Tax=Kocuria sp. cx-455 TaxID=2771377 RepID=UPI001689642F|nr:hypothetical protein [Kocuria sp. cx-455]MBD2763814.1 hypothetical protein [Kocuria sp. cx-455]